MKRLMYNCKKACFEWSDYQPETVTDFGKTVTKQKKAVSTKVMVNNQEVQSGNSRVALYTMPGGVDTGVRYSALYEHSGLDVTEIEANKRILTKEYNEIKVKIKDEFEKGVEEAVKEAQAVAQSKSNSNTSSSSES